MATPPQPSLTESQVIALVLFVCFAGAFIVIKGNEQARQRQWEFQKEWNEMGTRLYKEFRH